MSLLPIGPRLPSLPCSYPAPRAAERSVFSDLECIAALRLSISVARSLFFFLQFAFQIGNIFFKTDDPLSGHDG
jgi:hypothetical protein